MRQPRQTVEQVHENLCELLDWQFAERNDQAVAQALHSGEGVDAVYGLDHAGLLDGFFAFLEESGIKTHWQSLTIAGMRYLFVPVIMFVLLYGTRILFGIESSNALPALLFSNVAAMTLIGFNAHEVADGLRSAGKVIGQIFLKQIEPPEHLTCELGYILNPTYQRQGYGAEAAAALVRQALTAGGMHRIVAHCNPKNTASWKLLEKTGFRREGLHRQDVFFRRDAAGAPLWTDTCVYALLAAEVASLP